MFEICSARDILLFIYLKSLFDFLLFQALHLSSHSVQNTSPENIIKLMAQDSQKLDQSLFAVHYIWLGPLSLSAICVYLYYTLDSVLFLAGILTLGILVLPVQAGMTKVFSILRYLMLQIDVNRACLLEIPINS